MSRIRSAELAVLALSAIVISLAGCGENPNHPPTHPVTGTLTYKSQPVAGAQVIFQAQGAPLAQGITDAAGKFSLMTFEPGDGAVAGNHKITVVKMDLAKGANPADPYAVKVNVLPPKYSKSDSSPLQKDVGTGKNDFTIELTD